ncbi:MAG: hypothetical protein Q9160_003279 [Pyrenula sp. 1 TL-2023]
MIKKLCGDDALKNVILVTTMWDRVSVEEGNMREEQLVGTQEFWGWMMSKGSKTFRHNNTLSSADSPLRHFLPNFKESITLEIQQEMVEEKKTLDQTGAGKALTSEIARERERFTRELNETKEQLREAMAQRDQESEQALREVQSEYEAAIQRLQKDQEQLMATVNTLEKTLNHSYQQQLEARLRDYEETAKKRNEQAVAESTQALRDEIDALKRQGRAPLEEPPLPANLRSLTPSRPSTPAATTPGVKTEQRIPRWDNCTVQTLEGDSGELAGRSLAFSPDSQLLASYAENHTVRLWHSTGTPFKTLTGHKDRVNGVSFSPDGKLLASCSSDSTIRFWDPQGEDEDKGEGNPLQEWTCPEIPSCADFSPDGQTIASGSYGGPIFLWRATGELLCTLQGHSHWVQSVAFSPKGRLLASGSDDYTVRLWNLDDDSHKKLSGHSGHVYTVAFSSDGQRLASCSKDQTIFLWDPQQGKLPHILRGHSRFVTSVSFSPCDNLLASCSWDRTVLLWDLRTMTTVQVLQDPSKSPSIGLWDVTFSPDGRHLAYGNSEGKIYLRTLSS